MKESAIQTKILNWLKDNGYYTVKTIICSKNGVPDILACSPTGQFVAIEVKTEKGKTSKLQDYNLECIAKNSGIAIVARSLDDVINCLKQNKLPVN